MKLVRYIEAATYHNYVFDPQWLQKIPAIEGLFIVTDYELELIKELNGVDIIIDTIKFDEKNLSIISEDEEEIALFKKWHPQGFTGFPWYTHFIERETERLMELGWEDYENHVIEYKNNWDEVSTKSLEECLADRKIKKSWQPFYIRGWQWAEPGKEYPWLQTIAEPIELTEARREKKRKRAEKKRESDRRWLEQIEAKKFITTLTHFPQGKFPNEKKESPWYRNE